MNQFEKAIRDPELWLLQARQFFLAGQLLCPHIRRRPSDHKREDRLNQQVGALRGALLLFALAVESALKAVIVLTGAPAVSAGRVTTKSWGGGGSGHDLSALARTASLTVSHAESALLLRYSKVAVWAGKYRYPNHEAEFLSAQQSTPHSLMLPSDARIVEGLLNKCEKAVRAK